MVGRKLVLSLMTIGSVSMLMGCNSDTNEEAIDITEFSFVEFSGENGEGRASHGFDQRKLGLALFDYDVAEDSLDEKTVEEMDALNGAYTVSLDKQNGLSNGDKVIVKVEVDESKTDKIKDAEKTFEVSGLQE